MKKPITDPPDEYSEEDRRAVFKWIRKEGLRAQAQGDTLTERFFLHLYQNRRSLRQTADMSLDKARENGYRKRDWGAYLRNWIRRDLVQFLERHGSVASPDRALEHKTTSRAASRRQLAQLDLIDRIGEMP